jgi:hypothetical protein
VRLPIAALLSATDSSRFAIPLKDERSAHQPPSSAFVALEDGSYRATDLTRGPWDPAHQHAGPPIALVARAIEREAAALGLTHVARITANLLRPIPIGKCTVEIQTEYAGRNTAHFAAQLRAGGKEVASFTALAQPGGRSQKAARPSAARGA